jgi:hypothetical protein
VKEKVAGQLRILWQVVDFSHNRCSSIGMMGCTGGTVTMIISKKIQPTFLSGQTSKYQYHWRTEELFLV